MTRTLAIVGFLILAAGAAIAAWAWQPWMFSPNHTIRIATGPLGSDGQKFIAAFPRELAEQHPRVCPALTETANLQESAEALLDGKVDLSVVRSDHSAATIDPLLATVEESVPRAPERHQGRTPNDSRMAALPLRGRQDRA